VNLVGVLPAFPPFSQFTFLLDLLEIPIKYELGLAYNRYDGGMSRVNRDAAAQDFQDPNSRTKVMLVSLKAGNAGLNLTAANHVIIMDPFWNPYIEMQAVDRAYRIGQQKPVDLVSRRVIARTGCEASLLEIKCWPRGIRSTLAAATLLLHRKLKVSSLSIAVNLHTNSKHNFFTTASAERRGASQTWPRKVFADVELVSKLDGKIQRHAN
jgi:hypothetical protein